METLLLIAVFLPLAAALLPGKNAAQWRWRALAAALATLVPAAVLLARYPPGAEEFAATNLPWLAAAGVPVDVRFHVALDGLSLWLFGLTALLTVVAVLVSWEAIVRQQSLYYRLLLVLETGMLGVFVARDIILFYLFFEFTLVPLFFLIGIWGSHQRRYAAMKFFLFTLTGSVLTLLGLLAMVLWDYSHYLAAGSRVMTFSIPELTRHLAAQPMDAGWQFWIFLALFAGFAVKVPLVPLHTWLPLAHVEAPAAGSVLLAGVLLKIGAYGFVRFSLPMLPAATAACMPWLLWLSLAGIIYGALVALAQSDMKRLIAYSSVSHMGFCMLGVFAVGRLAVAGRRFADGQPRPGDRRAVRRGRHDLRALSHAADRRPGRSGPADAPAGLLRGLRWPWPASACRARTASSASFSSSWACSSAAGPRRRLPWPSQYRVISRRWPRAASCWGRGTCWAGVAGLLRSACGSPPAAMPSRPSATSALREVAGPDAAGRADRVDRRPAGGVP